MKANLIGFFIPMAIAGLVYATKPSDQACIESCTQHFIGNGMVAAAINAYGGGRILYQVDDKIFFKVVTNTITRETAAIGFCGVVFYN